MSNESTFLKEARVFKGFPLFVKEFAFVFVTYRDLRRNGQESANPRTPSPSAHPPLPRTTHGIHFDLGLYRIITLETLKRALE